MLEIVRDRKTEMLTMGNLLLDGRVVCSTLELPWKDNESNKSCIPEGEYVLRRKKSPHLGYDVFEICDVKDRDNILIHIANYTYEILGCVALGMIRGESCLYRSKEAFKRFMDLMKDQNNVKIKITWSDNLATK